MAVDMGSAMASPMSQEQESYSSSDMSTHSEMMCQLLMGLGRLEAKVDMLMKEDTAEKESESGPELATNPAIYSNQLEFDLPPLF